jgi:hypothetical protein
LQGDEAVDVLGVQFTHSPGGEEERRRDGIDLSKRQQLGNWK